MQNSSSGNIDFFSILYILILGQGLFLSIALTFTKKGNPQANRFLALMMLVFSSTLIEIIVKMVGLFEHIPHVLFASTPFWYLLAPSYYFYSKNLVMDSSSLKKADLFHFIPWLIVIIRFSFIYVWPAQMKIDYFHDPKTVYDRGNEGIYLSYLYEGQGLIYLFLSLRLFYHTPEDRRTSVNSWIKFIYAALAVYMFINFLDTIYFTFTGNDFVNWGKWSIPIFALMIYIVAFLVFIKPEVILQLPWVTVSSVLIKENQNIIQRLIQLMESEKLHLNSELKYSDVATRLGISTRALSRALNEGYKQSFNDFVNSYRVNEVKKQIAQNHKEETLLAIALNSGFSNKSSFNRIFKDHTGMTPSEFIKNPVSQAY